MKRIIDSIVVVFPDFNKNEFASSLLLGDIRNYDSMNAVNLFVSLQDNFKKELNIENMPLDKSNTIGDIALYFESIGEVLDKR